MIWNLMEHDSWHSGFVEKTFCWPGYIIVVCVLGDQETTNDFEITSLTWWVHLSPYFYRWHISDLNWIVDTLITSCLMKWDIPSSVLASLQQTKWIIVLIFLSLQLLSCWLRNVRRAVSTDRRRTRILSQTHDERFCRNVQGQSEETVQT